jgi:hypothetical protein
MGQIVTDVLRDLRWMSSGIFDSLIKDLIVPQKPRTPLELLKDQVKAYASMYYALQTRFTYQVGVIDALKREIRELKEQLEKKDQENQKLKGIIRDQEFRLQEQSSRNKHRR